MVVANRRKLLPVETITLIYGVVTAIYIIAGFNKVKENIGWELLCYRLVIFSAIGLLILLDHVTQSNLSYLFRNIFPLALVPYWYPETYYFNEFIFQNLDPVIISVDQFLFGCQPSTIFSDLVPHAWFNELMNFAYFSFFFTIVGTIFYIYLQDKQLAQKSIFIILCSFFMYYICFIMLPVEGPQFYVFNHDEAIPVLGPMRKFLLALHEMGEKPTGAVPSSHIGIMLTYMTLLWQYGRKMFWWILPLSVLLAVSTVYIRAHYLIDVIFGCMLMPVFYRISLVCWRKLT